jgi:hypothetical protein
MAYNQSMTEVNIYCDESNHLESDKKPMVLGALYSPRDKASTVNKRIKEIKVENNLLATYEIKWSKVSSKRLPLYIDLINYFFDIDYIGVRAIIADKSKLDHERFNQDHDGWYYKMYYLLLTKMIRSSQRYKICLDRKDTLGKQKIDKLREVLCSAEYDFEQKIINEVREVHSDQVQMVQLVDLIIGAIQFNLSSKDPEKESKAKRQVVDHLKKKSKLTLTTNTLPSEPKLNLFFWAGKE